ncbi:hypothetical protein DJ031_06745 [bacterium endosymbiont of Escarpia laminata]|nr:MAG: hypothetical protein DJ031_06745 [bacterium endosymbiont of Escarpia laminata]
MDWKKRTFAERFMWARKEKSLTQIAVAKKIGLTRNAISYWENGQNEAEGRNLERAAEALEVSKDWLDTGKGSPNDRLVFVSDHGTAEEKISTAISVSTSDAGIGEEHSTYHTTASANQMEEQIYLEKYRKLSPDDRTRLHAIIDALDSAMKTDANEKN